MIHELRTYILRAGALPEYERLVAELGRPARGDDHGKLEGHWSSPFGDTSRLFTLWSFDSLAERERLRVALGKNEAWTKGFLPRIADLVVDKTNTILNPVRPPKTPEPGCHVYELRTDRVGARARDWLSAFERVLLAQATSATNIALWTTEIGNLGDIVHLWAYERPDELSSARVCMDADPAWNEFRARTAPTSESRSDILFPTSLSPLR